MADDPKGGIPGYAALLNSGVDHFLSEPPEAVVQAVSELTCPIAILGAGGKMGLHLCLMLQKSIRRLGRNCPIYAVSRFKTLRDREPFEAEGIRTIIADLSQPTELAGLPDAPTVFFLAGVKFGTASSPELLEKINVVVPTLVAEHYAQSRIVAFSTGCVYPFTDHKQGGADEGTPPIPVGIYAQSCLRREEAFNRLSKIHGTRVVLIRLNYSVEYRYGVLVDIATKVLNDQPVDVSMGYVNMIWQTDAIAHVIQSARLAANPPVPINITGPEALSIRDLSNRFGRRFGKSPKFVGEESSTAWLSDASWSHSLFGPPQRDADQMVEAVADWLKHAGGTWGKPTGFENRDGRF